MSEDNGGTGLADPAVPELIHKWQFLAMQAPPVMVLPFPPFSSYIPSISWASHQHSHKAYSQIPRYSTEVRIEAVGRDPSHLSGPAVWSAKAGWSSLGSPRSSLS